MENENKLPPEFKAKWVQALRSGKYKQCRETLFDGVGYCCLGVACKITGNRPKGLTIEKGTNGIPDLITGQGNSHYSADYNPIVERLASLNDGTKHSIFNPKGKQYSFSQIADYIEANL